VGGDIGQSFEQGWQVEAAIEAVLELGEVAIHVALGDRFQGPSDGGFEVAQDGVDPLEAGEFFAVFIGFCDIDGVMLTADLGDRCESSLVFWVKRLIPGGSRQAFVNPEHNQRPG